jgi:uncharacterized membrane protein SpoIIM required for sporulation
MIIDLQRFVAGERGHWSALESLLNRLERDPGLSLTLEELKHFHYLYERTSADLARITTFASEPDTRRYLESLVARAYAEIHETREKPHRLAPVHWFFHTFPLTFRRHLNAFWLSVAITIAGSLFGGLAVGFDPDAKAVIMPFSHLQGDPRERVAREEKAVDDRLRGVKGTFSTSLMTHNTRVSIFTLALGVTWGVGTVLMLFYNGVILGAVAVDYLVAGQGKFLAGWLLPHGSFEIPAILIAGQAGLVLGGALIGWGRPASLPRRLRLITGDLMTLIFGVGILLVWAGFVEAFLSQYHEPIIPYWLKISFGTAELCLLTLFLACSGAGRGPDLADSDRQRPVESGTPAKQLVK